jgi:hypothetical protein
MSTSRRSLIAALLGLSLSACGYALAGKGVVVDPSIKRVGIPQFRDVTGKPSLDQKITRAVMDEMSRRGRFQVVSDATGVDALVIGELINYTVRPVGFEGTAGSDDTTTQATRYEIVLAAKVQYSKVGETEPIWANERYEFVEEYEVGSDPTAYFDREEQAIDRLAENFSRSLVAAMLEAF